jgi:hypothetical protein
MTLTEKARDAFNSDCILVRGDCIRIYWYADRSGKWFPADGGPVKGDVAPKSAARLANRILKYRDLLPDGCRDLPIELGEMDAHGRFTLRQKAEPCLTECQKSASN